MYSLSQAIKVRRVNTAQMAFQGILDFQVLRTALEDHKVFLEGQVDLDARAYQG